MKQLTGIRLSYGKVISDSSFKITLGDEHEVKRLTGIHLSCEKVISDSSFKITLGDDSKPSWQVSDDGGQCQYSMCTSCARFYVVGLGWDNGLRMH